MIWHQVPIFDIKHAGDITSNAHCIPYANPMNYGMSHFMDPLNGNIPTVNTHQKPIMIWSLYYYDVVIIPLMFDVRIFPLNCAFFIDIYRI